ncbi:hypothetical protein M3182_04440 [Mesobacillus maritimus]|uniref:hypothetical protein n=1 Tax=Mesobacillus maritimus TaxID=1643336 RepID=UPI0020400ACB|nr:hypothetical protein [Mesobacillus maritimus]MCM3584994.1 hypothetical protein [Mesobacillus maritimus]
MLSFEKNKWEAYVGFSQNEALKVLEKALDENGVEYNLTKGKPNVMYDSKNDQFIIKTDDMCIALIYVSADPITRLFANLIGTGDRLGGITLISIKYANKTQLIPILNSFVKHSTNHPWKINAHPRFQFAVLLQLINKFKWKKVTMD